MSTKITIQRNVQTHTITTIKQEQNGDISLVPTKSGRGFSTPSFVRPVLRKRTIGDSVKGPNFTKRKNSINMRSASGAPSRIASALSAFEANISKNSGHTSRNFLSNVASRPMIRRPAQRRHSLTTAKDIEDEYDQIMDGDFKTNPLISPPNFHRRTGGSASRPGLPLLSLFDDKDGTDSFTEHVVLNEEEDEDDSVCELDEDDDEESITEKYQEPDVAAGVAVTESVVDISEVSSESYREPAAPWYDNAAAGVALKDDNSCEASQETNATEADCCESDGETYARNVSILPSFEEQTRVLRIRDRKPVVSVSPIKLKDRMRAFQQDLTLNTL